MVSFGTGSRGTPSFFVVFLLLLFCIEKGFFASVDESKESEREKKGDFESKRIITKHLTPPPSPPVVFPLNQILWKLNTDESGHIRAWLTRNDVEVVVNVGKDGARCFLFSLFFLLSL